LNQNLALRGESFTIGKSHIALVAISSAEGLDIWSLREIRAPPAQSSDKITLMTERGKSFKISCASFASIMMIIDSREKGLCLGVSSNFNFGITPSDKKENLLFTQEEGPHVRRSKPPSQHLKNANWL